MLTGVLPLRGHSHSSREKAAPIDELQLLDMPPYGRDLGILRTEAGQDHGSQEGHPPLRVGRQVPFAVPMRNVRLRHTLASDRSGREKDGREFSELRSIDSRVDADPPDRRCKYMEVSGLKAATRDHNQTRRAHGTQSLGDRASRDHRQRCR